MKNTKTKITVIVLMLLTFIGQAFAGVMQSCTHEMTMDSSMSMMTNDNMPDTEVILS